MKQDWDNQISGQLFEAVTALKNKEESKRFLRDLLTPQEIIELGKRWQAARMLNNGVPYSKVEQQTGLSSATIARVSRWLNKGMGGYKLLINRFGASHHNRSLIGRG